MESQNKASKKMLYQIKQNMQAKDKTAAKSSIKQIISLAFVLDMD